MPSLSELQNWMSWVICDPRGVHSALQNENPQAARRAEPTQRCLAEIGGRDDEERMRRLSVYAEGYFARLLDAIAEDFPLCKKVVGEEDFAFLAASYLNQHPSRTPNVGEVSDALPEFLRDHDYFSAWPYLHDLACVERAHIAAFYSSQESSPKFSQIAARGQEKLFTSKAQFPASLQFVETRWNVDGLLDEDNAGEEPREEATLYLIYRHQDHGHLCVKSFADWRRQMLLQLREGHTLEKITAQLESDGHILDENSFQEFFTFLSGEGIVWDFYE